MAHAAGLDGGITLRRRASGKAPIAVRTTILVVVTIAHLLVLWLLLTDRLRTLHPAAERTLALFDVIPPVVPPPPPPVRVEPADTVALPAGRTSSDPGGSAPPPEAVARSPSFAPVARPNTLDTTFSLDAPSLPIGAAPLPGLADGGNGGTGGIGDGSGNGVGSGDGGGGAGLRFGRANWIEQPSIEEVLHHFPVQAWRKRINGRVLLGCQLSRPGKPDHCKVIAEAPGGHGFGEAAMTLSNFFRIRPVRRNGRLMTEIPVVVPVNFQRRDAAMPPPLPCPRAYCMNIPGYRPDFLQN